MIRPIGCICARHGGMARRLHRVSLKISSLSDRTLTGALSKGNRTCDVHCRERLSDDCIAFGSLAVRICL
jgi:hypothetical protein